MGPNFIERQDYLQPIITPLSFDWTSGSGKARVEVYFERWLRMARMGTGESEA